MEAHFHGEGKWEEAIETLRMEQRGQQMTEQAAMIADGGRRSRPVALPGLKEARASSHHLKESGESEARVEGMGDEVEELTEAKWAFRMLVTEVVYQGRTKALL